MDTNQKKQFMRFIGIFLFAFMGSIYIHGQSHHQSQLTNKEWVNQLPGKNFYTINLFTDNEWVIQSFFDGVKSDIEVKNAYYLSDKIVDKFEPNSIGKSKSGRYIVVFSKGRYDEGHLEFYEILELTDTTLNIKHLRSGTVLEHTVK